MQDALDHFAPPNSFELTQPTGEAPSKPVPIEDIDLRIPAGVLVQAPWRLARGLGDRWPGRLESANLVATRPDVAEAPARVVFLAHYDIVAMPCQVQDPDRKGKVESGVGHAQKTPLKGQRFESMAEAQSYLDQWERNWADTRTPPSPST